VGFWQRFAVDVPFEDEWSIVTVLRRLGQGHLTLGALWAQHNENRMLVPRLIAIALAGPTRYDTRADMLFGIALLLAAAVLLVPVAARIGLRSWWWAVPPAAVLLSWVQVENLLWGFQLAWYLILAGLLAVVVCLARSPLPRWGFWIAAGTAVVASFSSLPGLFLWPCGLLLLAGRGVRPRQRWGWLGLGTATTLAYLFRYHSVGAAVSGARARSALSDPVGAVRYLLEAVGSVVRWPAPGVTPLTPVAAPAAVPTEVLGGCILALAALVVLGSVRLGWRERDLLVPACLLAFALLFDLALVAGRLALGVAQAASSRYTTYDLLWLVGIWFGLAAIGRRLGWRRPPALGVALAACLALLGVQVGLAIPFGWQAAGAIAGRRREAAEIVVAYPSVPRPLVRAFLYPAPPRLRADVRFLARRHLSLFAGHGARLDRATGIVPGGRPGRLLRAPARLAAALGPGTPARRAWTVLSSLYDALPWLRAAYPARARAFPADLLGWAAGAGLRRRETGLYLAPVRRAVVRLLCALPGAQRRRGAPAPVSRPG